MNQGNKENVIVKKFRFLWQFRKSHIVGDGVLDVPLTGNNFNEAIPLGGTF